MTTRHAAAIKIRVKYGLSAYLASADSYQNYSNRKPRESREQHPTTTMQKTVSAYPTSAAGYKTHSKTALWATTEQQVTQRVPA